LSERKKMEVTVKDVTPVKKSLQIEVPEKEVISELDSAYKELKKTAKVKGFRPGKAPRNVLEKYYKKDVNSDVVSKLVQKTMVEAFEGKDFKIVGQPVVEPSELEGKGPYKYQVTIEVKPEIKDIDYKGLTLKETQYKISDGEVDAQLQMLQKTMSDKVPVDEDRPVRVDDFAFIDYECFKDGEPFKGYAKAENFALKVGSEHFTKEFDDAIIGMNIGESKEISIDFSEDYSIKKLAGLEILFKTTLNEIRIENVPEIDDALAQKLGRYNSIEELKQAIVDNLHTGYEKRKEQEINEQIFKSLLEGQDFEVPEAMIEHETAGIVAEAERSFAHHNMTLEQVGMTKEKLAERSRDTAIKQVRRHIILEKIIDQESLTLSDDELEEGYVEMSRDFGQSVEEIKKYYEQNKDNLEFLKYTLLEKSAIRLIINSGNVEKVEPEIKNMPDSKEKKDDNDKE